LKDIESITACIQHQARERATNEASELYFDHPAFEKPTNEKIKIWRYMDFTKFVSLLDKKSLYFSSIARLDDPFEGSMITVDPNSLVRELDDPNLNIEKIETMLPRLSMILKGITRVNCWYMNDYESSAMWKLYLKSNEGIAIQSTFKRLCDSFHVDNKNAVFVGKVKYIDYDKNNIPTESSFSPFLHKRISFQHEKELRVIINHIPTLLKFGIKIVDKKTIDIIIDILEERAYIPIDLEILIERIYISPASPSWILELTESVVKKYDLEKEIIQSNLSDKPLY